MKWYIVRHLTGDWDNIFILKANNAKEAINTIFEKHFKWQNPECKERGYSPFTKSDLAACLLEIEFMKTDYDGYICLN